MKTYYQLLEIQQTATADDIKHAFRREIAKYHPDKVHHLGPEFQAIARAKASELTQAYKTLTDTGLRAGYDQRLAERGPGPDLPEDTGAVIPPWEPPVPAVEQPTGAEPPPPFSERQFSHERAGVEEFIRRAAVNRFRAALAGEFKEYDSLELPGFDVTCAPRKPAFWSKAGPRVFARIVDLVDGAAVSELWSLGVKANKDVPRELCLFLLGPTMAPASELATAIAEQRRRGGAASERLCLVPVSITDWSAHVPTDAPPAARSLIKRLRV